MTMIACPLCTRPDWQNKTMRRPRIFFAICRICLGAKEIEPMMLRPDQHITLKKIAELDRQARLESFNTDAINTIVPTTEPEPQANEVTPEPNAIEG
jgi:hypothetical protein